MGVAPLWLAGWLLLAGSLWWLNWLVNNTWPASVQLTQAEFDDIKRAVVLGHLSAGGLMAQSNPEAILALLGGVLGAVTGLVTPLVYVINQRFRPKLSPPAGLSYRQVLRQALWIGVWAAACTYLQMQRALGLAVALLVAVILGLIEGMLLVRARTLTEQAHIQAGGV